MSAVQECRIRGTGTPVRSAGPPIGRRSANPWLHRLARRVLAALERAHRRARLRRELEQLDDRLLRDIDVRRETLEAEANRPFWRP